MFEYFLNYFLSSYRPYRYRVEPITEIGDSFTALYVATRDSEIEVVKTLAGNRDVDVDVNGTDRDGRTPLYVACLLGHLDVVKALLDGGADVNKAHKDGFTPLYVASQSGYRDIVAVLIAKGAEVNKADKDGFTPLYAASENGHLGIVQALLSSGADVNKANKDGFTPLYVASQNGYQDIVDELNLTKGVQVNKPSRFC